MKKYLLLISSLLLGHLEISLAVDTPHQTQTSPYQLNGIDVSKVVRYFQSQVKIINKSVTIYNWSNPYLTGGTEDKLPNNLWRAQKSARSFWDWYGDLTDSNMYGKGLYGAIDVIATNVFGQNDNWVLLEMKIPVGFKMLDLTLNSSGNANADSQAFVPDDAVLVLKQFQCPTIANTDALFAEGGRGLNTTCQQLVRYIFKDILEIDAFAYSYVQTDFKACSTSGPYGKAFVITNDEWMTDDLIHYYDKNTLTLKENRILIQTLFLEKINMNNAVYNDWALAPIEDYLLTHRSYRIRGTQSKCQDDHCDVFFRLCNSENICDEVFAGNYPRPGGPLITAREATNSARRMLLWKDLEGTPKSTNTSDWLVQNRFACSGELPYSPSLKEIAK